MRLKRKENKKNKTVFWNILLPNNNNPATEAGEYKMEMCNEEILDNEQVSSEVIPTPP